MTHLQQLFINNIRYYRTQAGLSQLAFSEKINLSPNYLNAVENGKNFPSPEVLQKMIDALHILPYELFLEHPDATVNQDTANRIVQIVTDLKQQVLHQFDGVIEKCS